MKSITTQMLFKTTEKILLIPQFEIKMRSICVIGGKMSSIIKHKASNINTFERSKTKNARFRFRTK